MIDEVKKIKLEELNKQKQQYEEKQDSIVGQKSVELSIKLAELKTAQSTAITVSGNFSFFEKWITKRYEYKRFKEQSKRVSELPQLISQVESEILQESERVNHELETSGITKNLREIEQQIDFVEQAKTLYDLGITPTEAIVFLENNGIQPVLSESDKILSSHPKDYSTKSSLIGVHKTKYAPTANKIKSAKDANVEYKKDVTINGVEYEYSYQATRDTVHMAINDEVSSHMYGSWDDCKYAVLIPIDDIPNTKIARAAPMDTFTRGSIDLSENSWILCPKNEVERLKIFNPKVHILGYEGENVQGFSQPFLTQLGYSAEDVGMWNWRNEESARQFHELMAKEGIRTGTHTYTYFCEDEQLMERINQVVSLSKLLRDNNLITNSEDIDHIMNQLADQNQSFGPGLSALRQKTAMKSDIEPQAIKGNDKQVDVFLEEMKNNGLNISPAYQDIMKKVLEISIYKCDEKNKEAIFGISENILEEERKVIDELQNVLASSRRADSDKEIAYDKFISTAIGEAIVHSREREVSTEKTQEER